MFGVLESQARVIDIKKLKVLIFLRSPVYFEFFIRYITTNWEMVQGKGNLNEKFNLENKDDSHNLLSNMVDVRACYKPTEKVIVCFQILFCNARMKLYTCLI